ncbi:MAG: class I SAM-dependent methyltransferase [Nitrospinaceae bacterium]|jgi:hypothetical protein|nr:class I SAM-dependent methyltransferase [Nitrospinaceae bacterium]MBT3432984.1 class I SAM-dependent methyltransferase [Nitrospinaceae bacterium]MBT3820129.1 class I SAM-dependent methyltransferase [Nitrospinaceae bacterium]MBT4094274.1 class I SAM-dependent methyltransferase [Nitrospinaceae bacterium]MBT4431348.1 class I SAM-dependent methyltransferase [Nitrospinaceae bacterium]
MQGRKVLDTNPKDTTPQKSSCPLCGEAEAEKYDKADGREYLHCPVCRLIFVPEQYWPSPEAERARYDQHQNSPGDKGYLAFLETIATPLGQRLSPASFGLDYGCGPSPVLCEIIEKKGHTIDRYDPHYFPTPPNGPYDFIVSTETFEHFQNPGEEITRLLSHLNAGGLLGVMTAFWSEKVFRANWHYRRDFTHLCFYRRETMAWIAATFGLEILWSDEKRAIIFRYLP